MENFSQVAISVRHDNSSFSSSISAMTKPLLQTIEKIHTVSGMTFDDILNILTYCRCLPETKTNTIDKQVFTAQMVRWFDISSIPMIDRMYTACLGLQRSEVNRCKIRDPVTVEDYASLVAVLLCDNYLAKLDLIFAVYDFRCQGFIDAATCKMLVKEGVYSYYLDEEGGQEGNHSDMIDLITKTFDKNGDCTIDREEFYDICKNDVAMSECLGRVLPDGPALAQLRRLLLCTSTLEVSAFFRHERKLSLRSPVASSHTSAVMDPGSLYPVDLEYPIRLPAKWRHSMDPPVSTISKTKVTKAPRTNRPIVGMKSRAKTGRKPKKDLLYETLDNWSSNDTI